MDSDKRLERLHRFAFWLDEGVRLPGTRMRVGLDPVIGLVPGFGDAAGAVLSAAILVEAIRRGVSRFTLGRIVWNIVLDALLGAVPVIGDAFDFVWKANLKNVALIERHVAVPGTARKADRLFVFLLIGSLFLLCAVLMVAGVLLTAWLFRVIAGHP
jgi:nitrate reductase NapE component